MPGTTATCYLLLTTYYILLTTYRLEVSDHAGYEVQEDDGGLAEGCALDVRSDERLREG